MPTTDDYLFDVCLFLVAVRHKVSMISVCWQILDRRDLTWDTSQKFASMIASVHSQNINYLYQNQHQTLLIPKQHLYQNLPSWEVAGGFCLEILISILFYPWYQCMLYLITEAIYHHTSYLIDRLFTIFLSIDEK